VVEFDGRAMKIVLFEQVVHTHADLQDALVQVANLVGCRPPEHLEGLVLLEELARVELVDRLDERWGGGLSACPAQVRGSKPVERPGEFRMPRTGVGLGQRKGYTARRYPVGGDGR
jgi:hypothetical protein